MDKRIWITGPSGIGKTTMAAYIEANHGIPFISTSAKDVWPKYGITTHKEAHRISSNNPKAGLQYQLDILQNRIDKLIEEPEFICDRSPIDNLVYFMLELSPYVDQQQTEAFIESCRKAMTLGNKLIIIQFHHNIQLNDPFRIRNPYYHQLVSRVIDWVVWHRDINLSRIEDTLVINHWDLDLRKMEVDQWLGN